MQFKGTTMLSLKWLEKYVRIPKFRTLELPRSLKFQDVNWHIIKIREF